MEFYKVISNKRFIILSLILIIVNSFLFYNCISNDLETMQISPSVLSDVWCDKKQSFKNSEENNAYQYFNNFKSSQKEYQNNYNTYLKSNIEKQKNLLSGSLFTQNAYNKKLILKSIDDYSSKMLLELKPVNEIPLKYILSFNITDYILIISVLLLVSLFIKDNKDSKTLFLHACKNGRKEVVFSQSMAILLFSSLFILIIYFLEYLISTSIYTAPIDFSACIQSCEYLKDCPYNISIFEFLIVYAGVKIIAVCLFAFMVWNISLMLNRIVNSTIAAFAFFAIEYILYNGISSQSIFSFLKKYNILNFIHCQYLIKYNNYSFFSIPVTSATLLIALMAVLILINILSMMVIEEKCYLYNNKEIKISDTFSKFINLIKLKVFSHCFEFYKTITIQKGMLIFLAFIVVCSNFLFQDYNNIYKTATQEYLLDYYNEYSYDKNFDRIDKFIEKSEKKFENYELEYQSSIKQYKDNKIPYAVFKNIQNKVSSSSAQQEAVETLKQEVSRLKLLSDRNIKTKLINPSGYKELFDASYKSGNPTYIFSVLCLLVLLFSSTFNQEYNSGTSNIIRTAKLGRKNFVTRKFFNNIFITAIVYSALFLINYIKIDQTYMLNDNSFDIKNLEFLSMLKFDISIRNYIIIIYIYTLVCLICSTCIITTLSQIFSNFSTMLICAVIFVIPSALTLFNVESIQSISTVYLFDLNLVLLKTDNFKNPAIIVLVMVTLGLLSYLFSKKYWCISKKGVK